MKNEIIGERRGLLRGVKNGDGKILIGVIMYERGKREIGLVVIGWSCLLYGRKIGGRGEEKICGEGVRISGVGERKIRVFLKRVLR